MTKTGIIKTLLRIIAAICFVIYAWIFYVGTFGKAPGADISYMFKLKINYGFLSRINLVPFKTIGYYVGEIVHNGIVGIAIQNLVCNIILTLPLSIFLAFFFKSLRKFRKNILTVLIIIIIVELVQLFTFRGSFDIDDIILNMLGATVGFGIWSLKPIQWIVRKLDL